MRKIYVSIWDSQNSTGDLSVGKKVGEKIFHKISAWA